MGLIIANFLDLWFIRQKNASCTANDRGWERKNSLLSCQVHCKSQGARTMVFDSVSRSCACCRYPQELFDNSGTDVFQLQCM